MDLEDVRNRKSLRVSLRTLAVASSRDEISVSYEIGLMCGDPMYVHSWMAALSED